MFSQVHFRSFEWKSVHVTYEWTRVCRFSGYTYVCTRCLAYVFVLMYCVSASEVGSSVDGQSE